jgi:hypothetical protein
MAMSQNSDCNLSLTNTCVAAIVAVPLPKVFRIPSITHNAIHGTRPNSSSLAVKVALILLCSVSLVVVTMAARMEEVVRQYKERLRRMQHVLRFSYGRGLLRDGGGPNRLFLTFLFTDKAMAIRFLQDVGLLRSQVQCNTCGRDMRWSAHCNLTEGFRWRC